MTAKQLEVPREARDELVDFARRAGRSTAFLARRTLAAETIKDLEATMSAPGFYEDRDASKHAIEQHQTLMWEVGDLMAQWEALQEHAAQSES